MSVANSHSFLPLFPSLSLLPRSLATWRQAFDVASMEMCCAYQKLRPTGPRSEKEHQLFPALWSCLSSTRALACGLQVTWWAAIGNQLRYRSVELLFNVFFLPLSAFNSKYCPLIILVFTLKHSSFYESVLHIFGGIEKLYMISSAQGRNYRNCDVNSWFTCRQVKWVKTNEEKTQTSNHQRA